ncbi:MAG: ATP-dependent Clp protease proteolytic subunit [Vampirovibrionales bacterium]|nr:ATP-dependent Clp protease proteolytic subunit [Vampirovibrionales bacterium]
MPVMPALHCVSFSAQPKTHLPSSQTFPSSAPQKKASALSQMPIAQPPNKEFHVAPLELNHENTSRFIHKLMAHAEALLNTSQNSPRQEKPTIYISLHCLGGSNAEKQRLLQIMETIKEKGITLEIYADTAQSAGAEILANGSPGHRFISPRGSVLIHESRYNLPRELSPKFAFDFLQIGNYLNHFNQLTCQNLVEKSQGKLSERLLQEKISRGADWHMTPEEAVTYGIADAVKPLPLGQ